ncbi:MAG: hypothetical protein K0U84_09435 [Actinomycetia bacterium]|nr:hypothetical protein [Actinomycetes bacterium]
MVTTAIEFGETFSHNGFTVGGGYADGPQQFGQLGALLIGQQRCLVDELVDYGAALGVFEIGLGDEQVVR